MENNNYLSAKDVSLLLGINEKKVYALAQAGKLPGTKVTGKWLFLRKELDALLHSRALQTIRRFSMEYGLQKNILLIAGSDDPLMYAAKDLMHGIFPRVVLFTACVGSLEGLRLLKNGCCHIALSHLYDVDTDDYNFPFISDIFNSPSDTVVINLFYRNVGFISRKSAVTSFRDVLNSDLRFINRQQGSGIRVRVDLMLREEGINPQQIAGYGDEVYTHLDVAYHILNATADAGIATESAAKQLNLLFTRLFEERFDMVTFRDVYFSENVQSFIEFVRSETFSHILHSMSGYDNRYTGKVVYAQH